MTAARKRAAATEFVGNILPEVIGSDNFVELSLDTSSSCIGWALGVDGELVTFGKLVFRSTAGIGEKLQACLEWFNALLETYRPARILFERPLSRKGNVTQRHAELIGVMRCAYHMRTGQEIPDEWFIAATTVKRVMNVRRGRGHDENKRIMVDKINEVYGLKLKYHRNSKIQTDDDTADAIAVLETSWRLQRGAA